MQCFKFHRYTLRCPVRMFTHIAPGCQPLGQFIHMQLGYLLLCQHQLGFMGVRLLSVLA